MSLRIRLFLMLSGLVLLLVLAQWWWVGNLTRGLAEEVDAVALQVGNSVAQVFADADALHSLVTAGDGDCTDGDRACEDVAVIGRMIQRTTEDGVEIIEGRTFTWQGDEAVETIDHHTLSKAGEQVTQDRAASSSAGVWLTDPHADRVNNRIALHYSFHVQSACADGDTDCLVGEPKIIMMPPRRGAPQRGAAQRGAPQQGVPQRGAPQRRHLVLNVEARTDPNSEAAAVTAAGSDVEVRRIPIPGEGVRARVERFSNRLWLGASALLTLGLIAAAVVAHRVTAPLRRLSDAAAQVGDGALGTQVDTTRADREVGQALGAFNRMSERLASLDRTNRELAGRQHLGEIGDIARGLAHTLRNPLNALGLSLEEIASKAADGGETDALVTGARRQIRRIDTSIRSFLALTSHGGAVETVDVAEMARDVALEALQDGGGRVRVEVEADQGPRLAAVAPELRAVLQALVVNAIEASPDGASVTVAVAEPEAGRARVTVADRGPGLPESIREHLFMPHQTTKAHGSGMGLFLAHRIATMRYAGSLSLDDRAAGGTRAILDLGSRSEGDYGHQSA